MIKFKEEILQAADGSLVLKGIPSIGGDRAVSFGNLHAFPPNAFPKGTPKEVAEEMFWGAVRQRDMKRA